MGISPPDDVRRLRLVDSLLNSHLRPGMSRAEGRALLGEPETSGSGGTSKAGTYQKDGYALVFSPVLTLPSVLLRWRTESPYLYVRYENDQLVRAEVK
jgi:hypothetical protein